MKSRNRMNWICGWILSLVPLILIYPGDFLAVFGPPQGDTGFNSFGLTMCALGFTVSTVCYTFLARPVVLEEVNGVLVRNPFSDYRLPYAADGDELLTGGGRYPRFSWNGRTVRVAALETSLFALMTGIRTKRAAKHRQGRPSRPGSGHPAGRVAQEPIPQHGPDGDCPSLDPLRGGGGHSSERPLNRSAAGNNAPEDRPRA